MAEGADIHEGLMGADRIGKLRRLLGLIGAGKGKRRPGDTGDGMQDAEAGPRGGEIRHRPGLGFEDQPATRGRMDIGLDLELAAGGFVEGAVADAKPIIPFGDIEIGDPRRRGFPPRSADDEGDAAQRFDALQADVAELSGFEVEAERPLHKGADRRGRLLGAIENDPGLDLSHRHRRLLCQSPEPAALPGKSTIFATRRTSRLQPSLAKSSRPGAPGPVSHGW